MLFSIFRVNCRWQFLRGLVFIFLFWRPCGDRGNCGFEFCSRRRTGIVRTGRYIFFIWRSSVEWCAIFCLNFLRCFEIGLFLCHFFHYLVLLSWKISWKLAIIVATNFSSLSIKILQPFTTFPSSSYTLFLKLNK